MDIYLDPNKKILKDFEVDIWLWTEANVNWSKKTVEEAEWMGYKIFNNFKMIISSSDDPADWKQPRRHVLD
eukprot:1248194-Ditylum_brightwellii.AAC.1